MTTTLYRMAWALARHKLEAAQKRRTFPTIRPACLRILDKMPPGRLVTIADLRADLGGSVNDVREDVELLAYALLVHAPGTLKMDRARPEKHHVGGSTPIHYILLAA